MGLPTRLHVQPTAHEGPGIMAAALQHNAPPRFPWRPTAGQPSVMNLVAEYSMATSSEIHLSGGM